MRELEILCKTDMNDKLFEVDSMIIMTYVDNEKMCHIDICQNRVRDCTTSPHYRWGVYNGNS